MKNPSIPCLSSICTHPKQSGRKRFNISYRISIQLFIEQKTKQSKKKRFYKYNVSKNSLPLQCFNKQLIVLQI